MAARVQVVVEAKDSASGILRGITSQFGQLGQIVEEFTGKNVNWGNAAALGAQMAIDGLKDAVKVTQEYASEVRDLALISGQGAEEASRLLQVLDDFEISADDVNTAVRAMTKEGLTPTVETLAKLSDQYLQINNAQEKNEFILKNLGRSGLQWVNVLNQGSSAIRELNAGVNESLILTDDQIRQTEEYRLAVDELNDTWMAVKVSVGTDAIPFISRAMKELNSNVKESGGVLGVLRFGFDDIFRAMRDTTPEIDSATRSYIAMSQAMRDNQEVTQELATVDYKSLISSIQNTQAEMDKYHEKNVEIKNDEFALAQQKRELLAEIEKLNQQGYGEMSDAVQEARQKIQGIDGDLAENKKKLEENEKAHQRWAAQTVFAFAQAKAAADGSITQGEGEALIAVGKELDLFDEKTVATMESVNDAFDSLDTSNASQVINTLTAQLKKLTGTDWNINITTTQTGAPPTAPLGAGEATCFISGTRVTMGDRNKKKIENIKPGDEVVSFDLDKGRQTITRVVEVFEHDAIFYLLINNSIGVTPEHLMFVNGDWLSAGKIEVGDTLMNYEGGFVLVESIQVIGEDVKVYNIHLDRVNNYYANGHLVHNAKAAGGAVYAGAPTMVGESGAEPFFPAQNGRILGHAESLHAMSLGGGGSNYFYGNVTLEIGEGDANSLMGIR